MHKIALTVILNGPFFFFLNLGAVPFLFPPHPHPSPSGCARVSITQSHCDHGGRSTEHKRFLDENLQFKAGFRWLLKEFLVIKDNKEIFDTLHTAAYGAKGNFFRLMVVLTDFEEFNSVPRLRAAVYYSNFA